MAWLKFYLFNVKASQVCLTRKRQQWIATKEDNIHDTSGLAFRTCLNCFKSVGGESESCWAPRIAIGTLTPEKINN